MSPGVIRVGVIACLVIGCRSATPVDVDAEGRALMEVSREWSRRAATGNLDSILTVWAEDAVMMPPGMPPVRGKAAIRQYVEAAMRIPGFSIRWEPLEAHVSPGGDMAYLIEQNTTTMNDSTGKAVTTRGKVVTVWRKDSTGAWKNVIDMWNDAPASQ